MSDFFDLTKCGKQTWPAGKRFGIQDSQLPKGMAYSKTVRKNCLGYQLVVDHVSDIDFAPIDHNLKYEAACVEGERKCDCFLSSPTRAILVFIELKNRKTSTQLTPEEWCLWESGECDDSLKRIAENEWADDAINQLKDTITKFKALNALDLNCYPNIHWAVVGNQQLNYGVEFPMPNKQHDFYLETLFQLFLVNYIDIPGEPVPEKPKIMTLTELKSMTQ